MKSEDERLNRCRKCKHTFPVYCNDGWHFIGCNKLKCKWILEIENCPLQEDNQRKVKN